MFQNNILYALNLHDVTHKIFSIKNLHTFQRNRQITYKCSCKCPKKRKGTGTLFPYFQQGEVSLLFVIYICSYNLHSSSITMFYQVFHRDMLKSLIIIVNLSISPQNQ